MDKCREDVDCMKRFEDLCSSCAIYPPFCVTPHIYTTHIPPLAHAWGHNSQSQCKSHTAGLSHLESTHAHLPIELLSEPHRVSQAMSSYITILNYYGHRKSLTLNRPDEVSSAIISVTINRYW